MGVVGVVRDLAPDLDNSELEQCYEQNIVVFEDRMKNVLSAIKAELETFSWFCSKIYVLEVGEYAIGVSRDESHLTRDGESDELDTQLTFSFAKSKEVDGTRGGVSIKLELRSADGFRIATWLPYNLGDNKWVSITDEQKILKQMILAEKWEPFSVVTALRSWVKGKSAR